MRIPFEPQYSLGVLKIEDTPVNLKSRDSFDKLILALLTLYTNVEYRSLLMSVLEEKILSNKKETGRTGMNLWQIFVLAHVRLALNINYDRLHNLVNNHHSLRQILGIETTFDMPRIELEYQNIVDNVKLLDDATLFKINDIIVSMGHDVFKKKETEALYLKTDSFVVETNVHFPTDYNLLWDSARKTIDTIEKVINKYNIEGWRKLKNWKRELKNMSRSIGQASKKSKEIKEQLVEAYIDKANSFVEKIELENKLFQLNDEQDLSCQLELEYYLMMLKKHINLLERRVLKNETIPHEEKVFSIFEPYTEWINKGKQNPSVEFGKNVLITTDQYHLIISHKIMEKEKDSQVVVSHADSLLSRFKIQGWSFDKGFYSKDNKEILVLFIPELIMPKKGKLNKIEYQEEHTKGFKKLRYKHSAVESNINELEYRGLDRCPDRGYSHFKNYIALGICGYNLHRIGAELLRQQQSIKKLLKAA